MDISERLNYLKMKSRHHKELLAWYKKWWGKLIIIILILLGIIIIISTIIVINKTKEILNNENIENQEMSISNYYKTIEGDKSNYFLGPKQSLYENYISNKDEGIIDIVVFSNFSCEFSAKSSITMRKLASEFPDVRFVFRDSPSQDSIVSSIAARCAGEQAKFWEMHDIIFEMQSDLSLITNEDEKKQILKELAKQIDLNQEQFVSCLDEKRYLSKVKKDYEDGESLNIPGTPTWFINGKKITGTLSENDFRNLIMGLKNNINK